MRIAQVAPLAESVPPHLYGGTERVIAWLIDELVELGHEVTLFASGDSSTRAKLVVARPQLGQQHSPTIRKLDRVVVGVRLLRVHLAEAHELPGRLSAQEREYTVPDDILFKRKLGPRQDAYRHVWLV